jgi:hypothetical protein
VPVGPIWSQHFIWGNVELSGGLMLPTANAWAVGVDRGVDAHAAGPVYPNPLIAGRPDPFPDARFLARSRLFRVFCLRLRSATSFKVHRYDIYGLFRWTI